MKLVAAEADRITAAMLEGAEPLPEGCVRVSDDAAYRRGWPSGAAALVTPSGYTRLHEGDAVVRRPGRNSERLSAAEFEALYEPDYYGPRTVYHLVSRFGPDGAREVVEDAIARMLDSCHNAEPAYDDPDFVAEDGDGPFEKGIRYWERELLRHLRYVLESAIEDVPAALLPGGGALPPPAPAAELQREVGEWARRTFPHATPETIAAHLQREAREVLDSARCGHTSALALESADVLLLLLHLAHRTGFDLLAAAREKHAENERREWGPPDAEGVSEHVRPSSPSATASA